ncbi:MAG: response regulator [Opitutaceae bacterium]
MSDAPTVLVVEDDEDDFFLTQRVLRKFAAGPIRHVESGRAAIDYLAGTAPYADRELFPLPHVMFLDLKMGQVTGHEVLQWVRTHLGDRAPRIFVLTGSDEPRDRELVRNSGAAAGYIVKPLSAEHLKAIFGEMVKSHAG